MKQHSCVILKCPDCQCEFEVETEALGPSGRKVKCSDCSHIWFQSPEFQNVPQKVLQEAARIVGEKPLRSLKKDEDSRTSKSPLFQEDEAFKLDVALEDEAEENQAADPSKFVLGLLLVATLFTTVFFLRNTIVQMVPGTRGFYDKLGIPLDVVDGFDLRSTRWGVQVGEHGEKTLMIRGEMVNSSNRVLKMPLLQITMRGTGKCRPLGLLERLFKKEAADQKNGSCVLDRRMLEVGRSRTLPGQVVNFEAAYPSEEENKVTEILLKFKPSVEI